MLRLPPRDYLVKWLASANLPYLIVNTLALLYLLVLYAAVVGGAWPAFARERGQPQAHILLWLALRYLLAAPGSRWRRGRPGFKISARSSP